jgi:hypothetical protein
MGVRAGVRGVWCVGLVLYRGAGMSSKTSNYHSHPSHSSHRGIWLVGVAILAGFAGF